MKSKYDTCTNDKVKVSYLLYAMLIELGLSPSNKGTIYLKEIIEYIILNNLYDYSYKDILKNFTNENNYDLEKIRTNIKNCLYRVDYARAKKNFNKYLNLEFDTYYLSPSKFINIVALKYNN